MWLLMISMWADLQHIPGLTQSHGAIEAPMPTLEKCERERDRVRATWFVDGYRVSARCVYVRHYRGSNQ